MNENQSGVLTIFAVIGKIDPESGYYGEHTLGQWDLLACYRTLEDAEAYIEKLQDDDYELRSMKSKYSEMVSKFQPSYSYENIIWAPPQRWKYKSNEDFVAAVKNYNKSGKRVEDFTEEQRVLINFRQGKERAAQLAQFEKEVAKQLSDGTLSPDEIENLELKDSDYHYVIEETQLFESERSELE